MKLILTADVSGLGIPGDIVEVKNGYGRNFLLPRKLAMVASRGAEKQIQTLRKTQEARRIRDLDHALQVKSVLETLASVQLSMRAAADTNKLFGSVTQADVVSAVKAAGGPSLDKQVIELSGHIKSIGSHPVTIRLHPEVTVSVQLDVIRS